MQALAEQIETSKHLYKFYQAPSVFVSKHWDTLGELLLQALPPQVQQDELTRSSLLEAVVKETLQVWIVLVGDGPRKGQLAGTFSTYITVDMITKSKSLVVYTVTGYGMVDNRALLEGMGKVREYAKGKGCSAICANLLPGPLQDKAQKLGANVHKLAVWEI